MPKDSAFPPDKVGKILARNPRMAAKVAKEIAEWHDKFEGNYKGTSFGNSVEAGIRARHAGEKHWATKLGLPGQKPTKAGIRKKMDDQGEE